MPQKSKPIGDAKIKKFKDLIDSDSDSYGSEGQLKEKPETPPKKRGGKKRKGKDQVGDGES